VLDPRQRTWPQTYEGLQPGGLLVLNYSLELEKRPHEQLARAGVVDATKIAVEEVGSPVFSTCMLGATAATTGWVKLESLITVLEKNFSGELLKKNIRSVERGYREVKLYRWD
jgi:pyruvate ferredoxin oxidoreductase gamma subunit